MFDDVALTLEDRHTLLGGQVAYRTLAAGGYAWLTPLLVATAAATARLRAWVDAGGLHRSPPRRADAARQLRHYGDEQATASILDVLLVLPPPVRDDALANVCFLSAGRSLSGFSAHLSLDGRVIVLDTVRSDRRLRALIAHELGHAWSMSDAETATEADLAARQATTRALAVQACGPDYGAKFDHLLQRRAEATERLACALAEQWGFP